MLFVPLLLLKLSFFGFQDLLVGFPALLAVQHHRAFIIYAVGDFRQRVIATIFAKPYLLIIDPILLPA